MTYQEEIISKYESMGYDVLKNIRLNKSGYPDLQCLKNGRTTWIEVKEAKDTLKPLQKLRIDQLKANGFNAFATQKGKGTIY
jgi:Holliday junction resolvase